MKSNKKKPRHRNRPRNKANRLNISEVNADENHDNGKSLIDKTFFEEFLVNVENKEEYNDMPELIDENVKNIKVEEACVIKKKSCPSESKNLDLKEAHDGNQMDDSEEKKAEQEKSISKEEQPPKKYSPYLESESKSLPFDTNKTLQSEPDELPSNEKTLIGKCQQITQVKEEEGEENDNYDNLPELIDESILVQQNLKNLDLETLPKANSVSLRNNGETVDPNGTCALNKSESVESNAKEKQPIEKHSKNEVTLIQKKVLQRETYKSTVINVVEEGEESGYDDLPELIDENLDNIDIKQEQVERGTAGTTNQVQVHDDNGSNNYPVEQIRKLNINVTHVGEEDTASNYCLLSKLNNVQTKSDKSDEKLNKSTPKNGKTDTKNQSLEINENENLLNKSVKLYTNEGTAGTLNHDKNSLPNKLNTKLDKSVLKLNKATSKKSKTHITNRSVVNKNEDIQQKSRTVKNKAEDPLFLKEKRDSKQEHKHTEFNKRQVPSQLLSDQVKQVVKSSEKMDNNQKEKNAFIQNLQQQMEAMMAKGNEELPSTLMENLQKLFNQVPVRDVETSDEEEEYVEYIYKPRKYFLMALCNLCKTDLPNSKAMVNCSRCNLTFYCSKEHMTHDKEHRQLCYALRKVADSCGGYIFYKCSEFTAEQFRSYRLVTIRQVETHMNRPLIATEQEVILFPRLCINSKCREYKFAKLQNCPLCGMVAFCKDKPEHLNNDHVHWCKAYQLFKNCIIHQEKFGRLEPSMPFKVLKDFPAMCSRTKDIFKKFSLDLPEQDVEYAALTQIATAPLTAWYALKVCDKLKETSTLTIHLIGAEIDFEVDVLHKWELFFLHITPQVQQLNVTFVGPELNPRNISFDQLRKTKCCRACRKSKRSVNYHFITKIYHDYYQTEEFQAPNLICFFNAGLYRSMGYNMEDTWPATILATLQLNVPIVVTAYTEYEMPLDLQRFIQESNRCLNVIMPPHLNPFTSTKPERNFISDDEAPLMFKNYYCFVGYMPLYLHICTVQKLASETPQSKYILNHHRIVDLLKSLYPLCSVPGRKNLKLAEMLLELIRRLVLKLGQNRSRNEHTMQPKVEKKEIFCIYYKVRKIS